MTDPTSTEAVDRTSGEQFTMILADRSIVFNPLNEVQIAALAQLLRRLRRGTSDSFDEMARILDVIQNQAASKDDQEFLEEAMLFGKLRVSDFRTWFAMMNLDIEKSEQPAAPVARRGRK